MLMDHTHNENPADWPCAWISEETLSDIRLDDITAKDAAAIGPTIFRDAIKAYSAAVAKQDDRLLASDPCSVRVFELDSTQDGTTYQTTQPRTLAVCNGVQFSVALVFRDNRLNVVDIGNP